MDITVELSRLTRPSILVRAARLGASARKPGRKLNDDTAMPVHLKLFEEEARLNSARCNGDAAYSPTRHVEVLSNLLAAAGHSDSHHA